MYEHLLCVLAYVAWQFDAWGGGGGGGADPHAVRYIMGGADPHAVRYIMTLDSDI